MSDRPVTDSAASVRRRLFNLAKSRGEDFGLTLSNYAIERLIARIERSEFSNQFVLKGAQLFKLWIDAPYRPTRDLDLLKLGTNDRSAIREIFRCLCVADFDLTDGIVFDPDSIKVEPIRNTAAYGGVRVTMRFVLCGADESLRVDVGSGDALEPAPGRIGFPSALGFQSANILAYEKETMIAEKLESMVVLGIRNSRMKDFYDVHALLRRFDFEGERLTLGIRATFARRQTPLPMTPPLALTDEFADDRTKQHQWSAFLRKSGIRGHGTEFHVVIADLRGFLMPAIEAIGSQTPLKLRWIPTEGWSDDVSQP